MAFVQLEDLYGEIEVIVFPNVYERHRDLLIDDKIIVVKGTVNCKEEEAPKILADKIFHIEDYGVARGQRPVKLRIPGSMDEETSLRDIKELVCCHPGDCSGMIFGAASGRCTSGFKYCG